ncbi:hypothetical protein [Streptomyces sp. SID8352]|uniref:hypothetical protein n=1 Tax=Streptomyces sp. SID8352 TaxID=2690338 RepID=UPI0013695E86|nr:hypothetical protein [Streptomyces sp. SID8352]MYU22706.1 hypothetical protein [Streptomyces sp. SID8352]
MVMGFLLYREVKMWAPPSLTHQEKLTALVLADDANDDSRLTYNSVVDEEIMRYAMVPDSRKMLRIVARLKREKVLEQVGKGHNGRTAKYRFLHLGPVESLGGENDHPTDPVGGSNEPPYDSDQGEPQGGEMNHPTDPEGWSFSTTKGGQKNHPYPSTSSTTTSSSANASEEQPEDATTGEPVKRKSRKKAAVKPNPHQVADDLTAAFWLKHGKGRAQPFLAVRGIIRTAIKNGVERDDLARALHRVAQQGRAISGATLDIALGEIRGRQGPYRDPENQDDYDQEVS